VRLPVKKKPTSTLTTKLTRKVCSGLRREEEGGKDKEEESTEVTGSRIVLCIVEDKYNSVQ